MAAVMLCGASQPRLARLTKALAPAWSVQPVALPPARLSTAMAAAASARIARRLGAVESVIIWPTLAAHRQGRNPGPRDWRRGLAAALRGAYLMGRASGLAFAARGGGRLLLIVDAPPADDAIADVIAESLRCLADGLRKALDPSVDVAQLCLAPARGRAPAADRLVVAQVRNWLAAPPGVTTLLLPGSGGRAAPLPRGPVAARRVRPATPRG